MAERRTFLLENDPPDLVDKIALRIAEHRFPGFELWAWFGRSMREDREGSIRKLMSMKDGDRLLMRHVFAFGYGQMESMLILLEMLADQGISLEVWMVGTVSDELLMYLNEDWTLTDAEESERKQMRDRLLKCLTCHRVMECWDSGLPDPEWEANQHRVTVDSLRTIEQKKLANCKHLCKERKGAKYFCMDCKIEITDGH